MAARKLAVAQHEAAHIVVGLALGLRFERAALNPKEVDWHGYAQFVGGSVRKREAWALMFAAGVAWEARHGADWRASFDRRELRRMGINAHGIRSLARAAGAMIAELSTPHEIVTRELLERDLTATDVRRLIERYGLCSK